MSTTRTGSRWRYEVQCWLAEQGITSHARPWMEAGDDITTTNTTPVLSIEAKNAASITLADFVDQADRQKRAPGSIPVVFVKRRGKGTPDAYVVIRARHFAHLLNLITQARPW